MASKIQFMRGLKSKITKALSLAEPCVALDTGELIIGTSFGNVNIGGSHWYTGTAMSGTSATTGAYSYSACPVVKVGDIYLNTSNGNIYECTTAGSGTTAKWTYKGNIKGSTGQRGSKWFAGTAMTGTSTTTGAYTWNDSEQKYVGDMYINPDNGNIYRCNTAGTGTSAKWTYQGNQQNNMLLRLCDHIETYDPNCADRTDYYLNSYGIADDKSEVYGILIGMVNVYNANTWSSLTVQYADEKEQLDLDIYFQLRDRAGNKVVMENGKSYVFKLLPSYMGRNQDTALLVAEW